MKWMVRALAVALTLATCGTRVSSEPTVTASMHTFSDSEENRVETYAMQFRQAFSAGWSLSLRTALDRVILPPLPGLPGSPENVDAITAASRPVQSVQLSKEAYSKMRQEVVGGVHWAPQGQSWTASTSVYTSFESDYTGRQVGVSLARNFNRGNTNLSLALAHGFDTITPELDEGQQVAPKDRNTEDLTFVWTQTVTPKVLTQLGFETTWVHGFQNNPYRSVYAGGTRVPEQHPERRFRQAVFGQVDRYLTSRASVSLRARYYNDDWGVQAGTFDARLHQYVGEHLIVRYRYRYHTQSAASFYRDIYESTNGIDGYVSGDYKLDEFDSNLFGVKFSVPFEGLSVSPWASGLVMDLKYERYFDSKSFAANILEAGFTWPF